MSVGLVRCVMPWREGYAVFFLPKCNIVIFAHSVPYNKCSIGICYEGGLDEQGEPCNTLTAAQRERITDLLTNLHKVFPKAKIVGHRDLPGTTPKACPCLDAHEMFGWIEH